ncbi:MAG: HNH endonuclease [Aggregatilineales bacterium]
MWTIEQTERHLMQLASQGVLQVFYGELYPLAGVNPVDKISRDEFHGLLGEVSSKQYEAGYPMISVIVVKNDNDKRPGPGFFHLARHLNPTYKDYDNETIFILEAKKVKENISNYAELIQVLQNKAYQLTEEDRAIIAQTMELTYREGGKILVSSYQYERNPKARRECINHYGSDCYICDFNFGQIFGNIGEGFIHVHHLKPLSEQDGEYEVDPIGDLRPVCPNCHAMLHKRMPPYSIEELKNIREQASY